MPEPTLTTFPAGTPLTYLVEALNLADARDVEARLQEAGLPSTAIERSGGRDVLALPVTIDPVAAHIVSVAPASPHRPHLETPSADATTHRRISERGTTDVRRRSALGRFVSRTGQRLVLANLEERLSIGPAELGIENRIIDASPIPEQAQFLYQHPQGRVLRSALRVSGDSGSVDLGEGVTGKIDGGYQIAVEIPYADFQQGGSVGDHVDRMRARVMGLWEVATIPSGDFAERLAQGTDFAPGTRIVRTFEVQGGAALGIDDHTTDAERRTRVTFEIRWLAGGQVQVQIDRRRIDRQGLALILDEVRPGTRLQQTHRDTLTYRLDPDDAGDLRALREGVRWTNGLLPTWVDTERLDSLGSGNRRHEIARNTDLGVSVWVPVGFGSTVPGFDRRGLARYTAELPNHVDGDLVPHPIGPELIAALETGDVERLRQGTPGAVITRTGGSSHTLRLAQTVTHGIELGPYVGAGLVARFNGSKTDGDVEGIRVAYDPDDPSRADVTLWRIDTHRLVTRFALEAGLTLEPALEEELAGVLADGLLGDIGLEDYAGKVSEALVDSARDFLEDIALRISDTDTHRVDGYEAVHLAGFNLRDPADVAAFTDLIERGDPAQALANGKFAHSVRERRDASIDQHELSLLGIHLMSRNEDWVTGEVDVIRVGGRDVQVAVHVAGAEHSDRGLFEDNDFSAMHFTVTRDGEAERSITKVSFRSDDDHFWDSERDRLRAATGAGDLEVLEDTTGDGGWLLSALFGESYGDGNVEITGVILPDGHAPILAATPEAMQQRTTVMAARVRGITLPPTEVAFAHPASMPVSVHALALLRGGAAARELGLHDERFEDHYPGADAEALAVLLQPWSGLEHARRRAAKVPSLAALPAAQLDELLLRGMAAGTLLEYLAADAFAGSRDEEDRGLRRDYGAISRELGGERRKVRDDLWAIRQGIRMRRIFERDDMAAARAGDADPVQLVGGAFREATRQATPDNGGEAAALAFWLSLFDTAGPGNWLGVVRADLDEYRMLAVSPGVRPEDVDAAYRQHTPRNALRDARQRAGAPRNLVQPR